MEDNEMLYLNPDDLLTENSMSPKGHPKTSRFEEDQISLGNEGDHIGNQFFERYKNKGTSITNLRQSKSSDTFGGNQRVAP